MKNKGKESIMNALAQQAAAIVDRLEENDQHFAIDFLTRLDRQNNLERQTRNAEYVAKIERSRKQINEGRGVVRELIEVNHD
jgi:hypothetical protein